ncbi:hypothetical protein OG588_26680 [Streptomyces prunicolor]|uniref:hypothetical protein n=1 Tax=Streptomyces prunicolor TaxID=67348 RepID=UPI0038687365|nr:hypothetical protein OG588_26680 [Streptomyces prunicolor]
MITVVGPVGLAAPVLTALEEHLVSPLAEFARTGSAVHVRAGHGLPLAAGRAARRAGLRLVTVLPSKNGVPAQLRESDRLAADELLLLSEQVRLLDYDPTRRDYCTRAEEHLLGTCTRVLAVWDGSPTNGRDATAHLVAFARSHGLHVDVLQPPGTPRHPAPCRESS